jgi:hypothetical protein
MSRQLPQFRALRIGQPWAERILRGEKTVEYRTRSTNIRGEVYTYASLANPVPGEDGDADLPRGLALGAVEIRNQLSIDIPRIIVTPKEQTTSGYKPFQLDWRTIRLQPVSQEILIQHLQSNERFRLRSGDAVIPESRLEDYLVRGLMDFDDIDYNEISELLYDLAGQMVRHIQSYLSSADDVLNVLQAHQQALVKHIHAQMQDHFEDSGPSTMCKCRVASPRYGPTTTLRLRIKRLATFV